MKKNITLSDVAKKAGVGIGTASRVLNNDSRVSDEKRKRVTNAMKELNYKPNNIARGLKSKTSRMLGIVVSDITSTFFSMIIKGIEDALPNDEYGLMVFDTSMKQEKLFKAINIMEDKMIDGIFFLGEQMDQELFYKLEKMNIPIVTISMQILINSERIPKNFGCVVINNERAAFIATDYLCKENHKEIALIISNPNDENVGNARYNGYCRALINNGIAINQSLILEGDLSTTSGYHLVSKLIKNKNLPSAIFAASDSAALGALRALLENKIKVPEEVSIVGFDGIESGIYSFPSLTTIVQPRYQMGTVGTNLMMQLLANEEIISREIILDFDFVKRESTKL